MEDSNKYYQSRHFLRLLHRYEKAIAEGQTPYMEADELTDIAEYYMTGKQDAKANQAIKAAIDMHPDSVDPQIFLARQRLYYGQLDEARDIIDAITEQDDQEVIYIRAELLIKEGHADKASDFLLLQMDAMQDCLDTYLYDCVSIFMDYDKWELAGQWLEHLKSAYPTHPRGPIMEAEIDMGLDDYEDAYTLLKEILEKEPYDSEAWNLLAETCIALEKFTEALEAADFALAINPKDSNAVLMKANAFMQADKMPEAIEHYKKYLISRPDDFRVQISLAICLSSEERYKEVLSVLSQAEPSAMELPEKKSELSQIYQLMAFAQCRLNKIPEALDLIKKAWDYCDESQRWRCALTEGDIYLQADQAKRAEDSFTYALEKCGDKGETLFNIALSYGNAGYNDVAIDLLEDVWTLYGTEEGKFVVPYIANYYLRKNDMEHFLTYLQLAPFCDRESTYVLFHDRFPGVTPEDYYAYAFKEVHGTFPKPIDPSDFL